MQPLFTLVDEVIHAYMYFIGMHPGGTGHYFREAETIAVENQIRALYGVDPHMDYEGTALQGDPKYYTNSGNAPRF